MQIIEILGETGDGSDVTRYLPAVDRAFFPIWQKQKPWLEQENNLFVASISEYIREFTKSFLGTGFGVSGTFVFPGAANNIFHMSESRTTLDGLISHVGDPDNGTPGLNVITLSAPPGGSPRDDLVFLEVWLAEIARTGATFGDTNIRKWGGIANGTYANDIQDPTAQGQGFDETTRRVQVRWRIRVVDNVDFGMYADGINDPVVLAQAEKGAPVATYTFTEDTGEKGKLYRAGAGNGTSFDDLGALDGYVYATPIAKVARAVGDNTINAGETTDLRALLEDIITGTVSTTHAHDGTAGEGADIDHADLINVTINQHHARDHDNNEHTNGVAPANVTKAAAAEGTGVAIARADHKHDITTANVSNVTKAAAAEGTATSLARSDHKHDIATGVPSNVTKGSASEGTGTSLSRADHKHDITTAVAGTAAVADAAAEGVASSLARSDHKHAITAPAAPADVTNEAASAGTSPNVARQDHKHDISFDTPGTTAVGDTASGGSATSVSLSDHRHAVTAPGAPANVTKAAAAAGSSANVARQDHKHDITTAVASTQAFGDSAIEGTATSVARSDHKHAMPANPIGNAKTRRIYIPAFSTFSPSTNGAADGEIHGTNHSYRTKDYDKDTDEHVDIEIPIPSEYGGGNITWTMFWTAAVGTPGQSIYWDLKTAHIVNDGVFDVSKTVKVSVNDVLLSLGDLHLVSGTWSSSLPSAGNMIAIRVSRDADNGSDTLGGDGRLIGFSLDFGVS